MSDTALESPTALVSYAHDDGHASPHQLAVELRLRGIPVTRDIEAFRHGRALRGEMEEAVNTDVVVGHLGPAALESEAVIEQELRPSLHAHARHGRPLVILVPHGIGATRDEVDAAIAGRLPYSAQATWAREGESSSDPLDPAFCAQVAGDALRSLYGRARGPGEGRWQIQLVTRGTPRHADGFVIDATDLVGGELRRCGRPEDWTRVAAGMRELAAALQVHDPRRALTVTSSAHGTAGTLLGLAFSRAAGWDLCVMGRNGECVHSNRRRLDGIREVPFDGPPDDERLFVGVDLACRNVIAALDRHCTAEGRRPRRQIVFERETADEDLSAQAIADAAAGIAARIRAGVDARRPERIDLFLAAPAPFTVLLGSELDTLGVPLGLWEHDGAGYQHAIDVRTAA